MDAPGAPEVGRAGDYSGAPTVCKATRAVRDARLASGRIAGGTRLDPKSAPTRARERIRAHPVDRGNTEKSRGAGAAIAPRGAWGRRGVQSAIRPRADDHDPTQ